MGNVRIARLEGGSFYVITEIDILNGNTALTTEDLLQRAHLMLTRKQYDEAQRFAQMVLRQEPANADAQWIAYEAAQHLAAPTQHVHTKAIDAVKNPSARFCMVGGSVGLAYVAWHIGRLMLAYTTHTDYALPLWPMFLEFIFHIFTGRYFRHTDPFSGLIVLAILSGMLLAYGLKHRNEATNA